MLPSEIDIAAAVFGTIQYYGWGHIAIITQNEQLFTLVYTLHVQEKEEMVIL